MSSTGGSVNTKLISMARGRTEDLAGPSPRDHARSIGGRGRELGRAAEGGSSVRIGQGGASVAESGPWHVRGEFGPLRFFGLVPARGGGRGPAWFSTYAYDLWQAGSWISGFGSGGFATIYSSSGFVNFAVTSVEIVAVPEPSARALAAGAGLAGVALLRRRALRQG